MNPCDGRFWLIPTTEEDAEPWRISSGCGPVTVMANEGLVGDSWGYPKHVLILMMTVAAGAIPKIYIMYIFIFCWPKSAMQTTPPIYTKNKIGTNPRIYLQIFGIPGNPLNYPWTLVSGSFFGVSLRQAAYDAFREGLIDAMPKEVPWPWPP